MWRLWLSGWNGKGNGGRDPRSFYTSNFFSPPPPFGCAHRVRSVTAVSFNDVPHRELRGTAKVCRSGMSAMAMYDVTGWLQTTLCTYLDPAVETELKRVSAD